MSLIDRYLRAVKEQLPRAQRDDVIAELSENLRSQIEDEEATRGRPLHEDEEAAILKRFGNPMVVAARYRGDIGSVSFGRQLIGPELFPTYIRVLSVNVAITLVIVATILLVGGGAAWSAMFGGLVPVAVQFVIVTTIFIYVDRRFESEPEPWDPLTVGGPDHITNYGNLDGIAEQLIGKARTTTVPFTTSLLDLGLAAFGLTILRAVGLPNVTSSLAPGPGWVDLYAPVVVLFAAALLGPIVTLVRPRWVGFRVAARAAFDGVFATLLLISLAIGHWVVIAPGVAPTDRSTSLVSAIDLGVCIGVAATLAFTAVSCFLELRRLRQIRAG